MCKTFPRNPYNPCNHMQFPSSESKDFADSVDSVISEGILLWSLLGPLGDPIGAPSELVKEMPKGGAKVSEYDNVYKHLATLGTFEHSVGFFFPELCSPTFLNIFLNTPCPALSDSSTKLAPHSYLSATLVGEQMLILNPNGSFMGFLNHRKRKCFRGKERAD